MKISVIGAGYVGLTLAAVLAADPRHKVWVIRRDKKKNRQLKNGKVGFFEPELEDLVKKAVLEKKLFPTTDYREAIPFSDVVFIAVGTPSLRSGSVDLSSVFEVAEEIGKNLKKGYTLVINKSTVSPGTTRKLAGLIKAEKAPKADFDIVFSPEFLREGLAVFDTRKPGRIVFGCGEERAETIFRRLHKPFGAPIFLTNIESAEMTKYAANAYLALRIVFINEVADLCEKVGADIEHVVEGIGLDSRIGSHYWYPGLGYAGSCFPKDVAALAAFSVQKGIKDSLFAKIDELNKKRVGKILERIEKSFGSFSKKKVGVLGLSAKKGTDDIRGSPAIQMVKLLQKNGAEIRVFDPMAMENAKKEISKVTFCKNAYQVTEAVDALLVLNDWPDFARLDYVKIKKKMKGKFVFDSRNILPREELDLLGFKYLGVGR